MLSRKHEQEFIKVLKGATGNRLSIARLTAELREPWTVDRVQAKAREFDADDRSPLKLTNGELLYFGSETASDPGVYKAIQRGIVDRWAISVGIVSNLDVEFTSRAGTTEGGWTRPDLVVVAHLRSGDEFHAIKVEQPGGVGIQSVYQAYEQGRGADFAWVFCVGSLPGHQLVWDRMQVAAKELGVGIVHAPRVTVPRSWKTVLKAKRRSVTQRADFLRHSGLATS